MGALIADATTPAGRGPLFALAAICALAGLGDLRAILSGPLTRAQRLTRHLWRMCFAFFIATGSFFLGQEDILPAALQGSPLILSLAFAPLAIMLFWLLRLRLPTNRSAATEGRAAVRAHRIPAT